MSVQALSEKINKQFFALIDDCTVRFNEVCIHVSPTHLKELCLALRDEPGFAFNMLIDVCGIDYQRYGLSEWETETTTTQGYSRAVEARREKQNPAWDKPRFAVAYHLLSLVHNWRVRLITFLQNEPPVVDSVVDIWPSANWFEREAFDLFGILFNGHPDLRRILTDYGFVGHPFRKDFPLIGEVEMRYDATLKRCVYEPVSIQPRVLTPRVIRRQTRESTLVEKEGE